MNLLQIKGAQVWYMPQSIWNNIDLQPGEDDVPFAAVITGMPDQKKYPGCVYLMVHVPNGIEVVGSPLSGLSIPLFATSQGRIQTHAYIPAKGDAIFAPHILPMVWQEFLKGAYHVSK